jgi:hypothetical protein
LDLNTTSIRTCFLNLLLEFSRTTYLCNLYPIGLPDWLKRISPGQLTRSSPECLIRLHQCLSGLICSYSAESPYPILLPIGLLLTYPALHGLTRPNYLTRSFPDHTSAHPIIPNFLTRSGYPPMHILSSHPRPCNILWCNTAHVTFFLQPDTPHPLLYSRMTYRLHPSCLGQCPGQAPSSPSASAPRHFSTPTHLQKRTTRASRCSSPTPHHRRPSVLTRFLSESRRLLYSTVSAAPLIFPLILSGSPHSSSPH